MTRSSSSQVASAKLSKSCKNDTSLRSKETKVTLKPRDTESESVSESESVNEWVESENDDRANNDNTSNEKDLNEKDLDVDEDEEIEIIIAYPARIYENTNIDCIFSSASNVGNNDTHHKSTQYVGINNIYVSGARKDLSYFKSIVESVFIDSRIGQTVESAHQKLNVQHNLLQLLIWKKENPYKPTDAEYEARVCRSLDLASTLGRSFLKVDVGRLMNELNHAVNFRDEDDEDIGTSFFDSEREQYIYSFAAVL
jgi:hypothetical protein